MTINIKIVGSHKVNLFLGVKREPGWKGESEGEVWYSHVARGHHSH
jgi:hypothetical protein